MSRRTALSRRLQRSLVFWGVLIVGATIAPATAFAAPPLATTDPAVGVGEDQATLNGRVNPNGIAVATCRFEYGTSTDYGAVAPCQPSSLGTGTINVAVSAEIGQLEPGTTYHFRLVAASTEGATQGVDRTFTTAGSPVCDNADRRLEQGIQAIQLPDCMALEHVNPPRKFSQRAGGPTISADGSRVAFRSLASLAETPGVLDSLYGDVFVAERGAAGWVTSATAPPPSVSTSWTGGHNAARSFDSNLGCWTVFGSSQDDSLYPRGIGQLSRGCLGGFFANLTPLLEPVDGGVYGAQNVNSAKLQGASTDHTHLLLVTGESSATYLPDDPVITPNFDQNVYLAKNGSGGAPALPDLLSRDDADKAWGGSCGARVGGIGGLGVGWRNQGAVSADGSRIYFSTRPDQAEGEPCSALNKLRIMQRVEAGGGVEISELVESECTRLAPPCKTELEANGDDLFQGASVDGSRVYFTTNRQLADTDLDGSALGCSGFFGAAGCDLYLYDGAKPAGERLTQVSAGVASAGHPTVGEGANVYNGTTAISGDGSHVYFVAGGVLTPEPNPAGKTADEYLATEPKLYGWDTETEALGFIGALSAGDTTQLWGGNGTYLTAAYPVPVTGQNGLGEEVGGNGEVLVFQSKAALTAEDADGARLDAYRYAADTVPPTLECVSCREGGPDSEPYDVALRFVGPSELDFPGTSFAEYERWVSEDGSSIILRTDEPLLPADLDAESDDYLWDDGQLTLLPGTTLPAGILALGERPPVLSHDGSQIAFTAYQPLLPSDIDTAPDIYVARVNGGFANPAPEVLCIGEACRPAPLHQPAAAGGTASESAASRGNVVRSQPAKKKPRRCPKGKRMVKKNGKERCVKKRAKKRSATKKRANANRGVRK